MPDKDAVRWYRSPHARWYAVGPWLLMAVAFGAPLVLGAITSPGGRALGITGAVCVFCAGTVMVIWTLRAAGIGVAADHLIVWDAALTRHLLEWPSVEDFDLEEKWSRGHGVVTLVVIRKGGWPLHTSGCSFSGTSERSWAKARQLVQALQQERQARTPQGTEP